MKRRQTRLIKIGKVKIGGRSAISIQSMAKTDTRDIKATIRQIRNLEDLGCEIIRVAVKDRESAYAISKTKRRISIPLEADIHFDYRLALLAIESGADGIRLNPGNIRKSEQVKKVINAAKKGKIPIRIGVNTGSLPATGRRSQVAGRRLQVTGSRSQATGYNQAKTMVKVAADYLKIFEKEDFRDIIISLKASDVTTTVEAYRRMAASCDYPLHLGVTATGIDSTGVIKSAIGIGALLAEGIGDTIRVSLTSGPEDEVIVAKGILQALGLRWFGPEILSCPTCGRCRVDLVDIVKRVQKKLPTTDYRLPTKRSFTIALMGCEVNGPGEAKEADIGIAFGKDSGILFKKGKIVKKLKARDAVKELTAGVRHFCK